MLLNVGYKAIECGLQGYWMWVTRLFKRGVSKPTKKIKLRVLWL